MPSIEDLRANRKSPKRLRLSNWASELIANELAESGLSGSPDKILDAIVEAWAVSRERQRQSIMVTVQGLMSITPAVAPSPAATSPLNGNGQLELDLHA